MAHEKVTTMKPSFGSRGKGETARHKSKRWCAHTHQWTEKEWSVSVCAHKCVSLHCLHWICKFAELVRKDRGERDCCSWDGCNEKSCTIKTEQRTSAWVSDLDRNCCHYRRRQRRRPKGKSEGIVRGSRSRGTATVSCMHRKRGSLR